MNLLKDADPAAYAKACAVLASKSAPPGYQQPLVLSAIIEAADPERRVTADRRPIEASTALPAAQVMHAINRLVRDRWIKPIAGGYELRARAFGEIEARS